MPCIRDQSTARCAERGEERRPRLNYPRLEGQGFVLSRLEADSEAAPAQPRRIRISSRLCAFAVVILKTTRRREAAKTGGFCPVIIAILQPARQLRRLRYLFFALRRGVSTIPQGDTKGRQLLALFHLMTGIPRTECIRSGQGLPPWILSLSAFSSRTACRSFCDFKTLLATISVSRSRMRHVNPPRSTETVCLLTSA